MSDIIFINDGFSCYTVRFEGEDDFNRECFSWLSEELCIDAAFHTIVKVEKDGKHTHVEDLWDWLEPYVTKRPNISFVIEGYISNHSYYEDFRFEVAEGALAAYRSGWYDSIGKANYEDFEEFCDDYQDDDGNPICSKEEFDAIDDEICIFEVEDGGFLVVGEPPLDGPATSREMLMQIGL